VCEGEGGCVGETSLLVGEGELRGPSGRPWASYLLLRPVDGFFIYFSTYFCKLKGLIYWSHRGCVSQAVCGLATELCCAQL